MSEEEVNGVEIGSVTHYFTNVGVAVVKLTGALKKGDKIMIKGATSSFTQTADSMQIDRKEIAEASAGQEIGLKVKDHARQHDKVFKL